MAEMAQILVHALRVSNVHPDKYVQLFQDFCFFRTKKVKSWKIPEVMILIQHFWRKKNEQFD